MENFNKNLSYEIKWLMSENLSKIIELRDEFNIDETGLELKVPFQRYEYIINGVYSDTLREMYEDLQRDNIYLKKELKSE